MVEQLPNLVQFSASMNPKLKGEKDFLHALDKCHPLAVQEGTAHTVRLQMCNDLTTKVNPNEKSNARRNIIGKYVECINKVEQERNSYLEEFKRLYPNSDAMEAQTAQDMAKIKRIEDEHKAASAAFTKLHNSTDPKARETQARNYKIALDTYNRDCAQGTNEFRKSCLERMELTVVTINHYRLVIIRTLDKLRNVLSRKSIGTFK